MEALITDVQHRSALAGLSGLERTHRRFDISYSKAQVDKENITMRWRIQTRQSESTGTPTLSAHEDMSGPATGCTATPSPS
jgi:hypothetical protein